MASRTMNATLGAQPRIPLELQKIFVTSNQGLEVHEPPASGSAFRVFSRPLQWLAYPRNRRLKKKKKNKAKQKLKQQQQAHGETTPIAATFSGTPPTTMTSRSLSSLPEPLDLQGVLITGNNSSQDNSIPSPPRHHSFKDSKKLGRLRRMFQNLSSSSVRSSDISETEHLDYRENPQLQHQNGGVKPSVSPQDYVDALIYARGYSTVRHNSLDSAYYNHPTSLQQASFRSHVLDLVRRGDATALKAHLQCGLSPNPANAYGESLAHSICRVGRSRLLQVLLDVGGTAAIQQADENGHTPLHKACAANSLECFELLVEHDLRLLFMADRLDRLPLEYVPESAWSEWIGLLQVKQDEYWPEENDAFASAGPRARNQEPPPLLTLRAPHSRPLQDPPNALPLDVAARVASGKLSPDAAQEEAKRVQDHSKKNKDDDRTLMESMTQLPLPRELRATMFQEVDADSDSDLTDSLASEQSDQDQSSLASDENHDDHYREFDGDDDDDDDDDSQVVSSGVDLYGRSGENATNSLNLAMVEHTMGVLGISARSRSPVQHC